MSSGTVPLMPSRHRWPVTLRHGPVLLRPVRRRDQRDWNRVRADNWGWLRQWEATPPPGQATGPQSFTQLARMLTKQAMDQRCLPWIIAWDPDGDKDTPAPSATAIVGRHTSSVGLIGQLTVSGITMGSARWGQIGYWIDETFAGRGIVPTAVCLATDYCFTEMGLHRIEIAIRPENTKSLRVVHKLGFRAEGMRPRYLHIDGDWRDHEVFSLTPEEVPGGLLNRWLAQQ